MRDGLLASETKFSLGEYESYTEAAGANNNYTANNIRQGPLFVFYTAANNGTGDYEYARWVEKTWYVENSYCNEYFCHVAYDLDYSYGPNGYGGGVYRNTDAQYQIGGRTLVAAALAPAPSAAVPAPLPLLGAGAAFGFSRQLRKRIQGGLKPLATGRLGPEAS